MGIANLIRNASSFARTAWSADQWPGWMTSASGSGPSTLLNVSGLDRPAENVLMVYGCLTARCEAIGGVALRVTDAQGNVVESGPLVTLLDKPNATMNWSQYVRVLETYNTLYNAMVIAKVGSDGSTGSPQAAPDELVPLSPGYLTPILGVHSPTGTAVAMEYQYNDPNTGASRIYKPEELIIHFGFNPHAPLEALSPLKVLRRTMQSELAAREQNAALFLNDSTPKTVLATDHMMTKNQADEALEKWDDRNLGFAKRHRTAVLWGGLKPQVLGLSPKEMDFLESLKFSRTDYYIVFRLYPAMLCEMTGETGLSQGSSTDSQKVAWWEDIGLSELDLIAGLHQELAPTFGGRGLVIKRESSRLEREGRARFVRRSARLRSRATPGHISSQLEIWFDDNTIPALVRHRLAKVDQFTKICALGYPPDDINEFLDLGLPEHPTNVGTVPIGVQPVGDLGSQLALRSPPGEAKPVPAVPAMRSLERIGAILEREALERASKVDRTKKAFDRFCAPREKAASRKWSRFFLEQRERVLARISSSDQSDLSHSSDLQRSRGDDVLKSAFPLEEENKKLIERIGPLFVENLKDGWEYFSRQDVGLAEKANPFAIEDPRVMRAIESRKIQGKLVNDTTEEHLREIIKTSFEEGLTTRDMGDRIAKYYADNCVGEGAARPMTAARTQTSGIINEGRMASAEKVGGVKKIWIHGSPNEPRPSHLEAAKRYQANPIDLDQPFEIGDAELMQPGDADAPIEEIANCTCSVGFVAASSVDQG